MNWSLARFWNYCMFELGASYYFITGSNLFDRETRLMNIKWRPLTNKLHSQIECQDAQAQIVISQMFFKNCPIFKRLFLVSSTHFH